ncbi:hypothetical protein ES705_30513 [subsurface metagenome]
MKKEIDQKVDYIVETYTYLVQGINEKALGEKERAYGGIIRAGKGKLVENIARNLIALAWEIMGGSLSRLSFGHKTFRFPIKEEYIEKIRLPEVRQHIRDNISAYYYRFKPDVQVYIDNKFVISIECKSYTENAMFKRILVDFTLLELTHPNLDCVLLQLESQLGGDYSELNHITFGSPSTHTLLSYFDISLAIITLLEGERKVDRPIHKPEFYKPLTKDDLYRAIDIFKVLLEKYR